MHLQQQFQAAADQVRATHSALREVEDPRVELALLRVSANVSRLVYLLRAVGPELDPAALDCFDHQQRLARGAILGGPLSDRVWLQAAGPAVHGGLGFRSACDLRFPAFLASRTEARGWQRTLPA